MVLKITIQKKNFISCCSFGSVSKCILLTKIFFKIVKKFTNIGVVDSRLITNALLLDKFGNQIFESGLVNLYISIDAFSEKTYQMQRGPGYKKVINNVLNFLKKKKKF